MTAPPGRTEEIHAQKALVLAPHYDDEVLGCGGLLSLLVVGGTEARVLFLSDGAGGVEAVADRPAYAVARRQEAEAVAEFLGISAIEHLGLPDGALEGSLPQLAEAVSKALAEHGPDLVLVPSPLEATPDHRATFAALHLVLSPQRAGTEDALRPDLEVLVYEVNHPFYPEVLVDVGSQLGQIRQAMELYPSQQERHDYAAAAEGLRRYRTLSLGPEVKAAEGYVRLRVEDFTT
ncbi:MAG: PIG-L family deacetylase, partial [Acidobacteria bacterium]|nr:PIG-L family deacetylase [Acidobacteriota bacterium]